MAVNCSVLRSGSCRTRGYTLCVRVAILLTLIVGMSGCLHAKGGAKDVPTGHASTSESMEANAVQSPGAASVKNPFSPRTVRIYPLTRIETDAKGQRIVCYIEFKDRWGDTTKSTGTLTISLYRPIAGVEPGMERQERSWAIDLSDLEKNALLFDPATRTYRLTLRDLPEWLSPGAAAMLRASMRGEGGVLSDDFHMAP